MATSGQMRGNNISIGGRGGQYYFINWQLASQNTSGNSSRINWQAYFHYDLADAQLDNGNADLSGNRWSNGGRVKNFAGTFTTRNHQVASGSFDIGHNNNGTRTLSVSGGITAYQSGRSSGSGSWALTTIPRYANINSWSLNNVTEKSIGVTLSTNATVNAVQYSLNGGGWVTGYSGNFTSRSFTISGLNPATTYTVRIRVRRADSGLWTNSGNRSATTTAVVISSATVPSATDTSLTIRATVNRTANRLEYRPGTSGTWLEAVSGNFTTADFQVTGLTANQNYSYQLRARHADSGTWTPTVSVTGRTELPVPLKPVNLSPNSSQGIDTQTPTLTWTYTASGPDTQSAFRVIVRNSVSGSIVHDSGKITSANSSYTLPLNLAWNTTYTWEVRTYSGTNIEGPYSDTSLFRVTQPPVIEVTMPEAMSELATASPQIEWTYNHSGSSPQQSFRVVIEEIGSSGQESGAVVFDTTEDNSDETSYILPADSLRNNTIYLVRVYTTTADGATGVSDPVEFSISFVAPSDPTIEVGLSDDMLFVAVVADTVAPENDAYETDTLNFYRRRLDTDGDWEMLGSVDSMIENIQSFDTADWEVTTGSASLDTNDDVKEGEYSLELTTSSAGNVQIERPSELVNITSYDRIRVWLKSQSPGDIVSVTFKFGSDSENYYSLTVAGGSLDQGVWHSIEMPISSLDTTGSPQSEGLGWSAVDVTSSGAIGSGGLLLDGLRAVPNVGAVQILDYELANGGDYQYGVRGFSQRASMETELIIDDEIAEVRYSDMLNTYLIPIYAKPKAVIGLMDARSVPAWNENTEKAYYTPVNAKYPVVYSRGEQLYRTGNIQLRFLDEKHGGQGLEGAKRVRDLLHDRPIMLRTWWGEILYVSINDQVSIERTRAVSWSARFNFTEIGRDDQL